MTDYIEDQLMRAAKHLDYPPTPDIAKYMAWSRRKPNPGNFRGRRLAWVIMVFLVAVVSLLSVPSVRAQLIEFLQIGGVRIFLPEPTDAISDQGTETLPTTTATPTPMQSTTGQELVVSVLDLDGATTLNEARQLVEFSIRLPTYPSALGEPDHVFLSDIGTGLYTVLAWTVPDEPEKVEISLYILGPGVRMSKGEPPVIEAVEVNGQPAVFVDGIHLLSIDGFVNPARLVAGPVLVWEADGLTYRLEAELPPSEMVRIAESLEP